jgi:Tfp pilus assembly protein PilO
MEAALLIGWAPLLVVILLVVISINLVLLPKIGDYRIMTDQLNTLEQQRQQLVQKRTYLLSIDQNELKKNSDFIVNAMLPQKNSYLLVGAVRKIADNYGYQIDSFMISPGDVVQKDSQALVNGVARIPIKLTVIGPSEAYLAFVKGLESSLPILSLDNFDMKNDGTVAKMDLTISAYYVEDVSTIDINKLTLADLTLTKDEADLITRLDQFTVLEKSGVFGAEFSTSSGYVKYNRVDPFSL